VTRLQLGDASFDSWQVQDFVFPRTRLEIHLDDPVSALLLVHLYVKPTIPFGVSLFHDFKTSSAFQYLYFCLWLIQGYGWGGGGGNGIGNHPLPTLVLTLHGRTGKCCPMN